LATAKEIHNSKKAFSDIASALIDAAERAQVPAIRNLSARLMMFGNKPDNMKIKNILPYLCANLDKDLVVLFDEIDCLAEQVLITFVSQIRDGYLQRGRPNSRFPRSLALVGVLNIMDYKSKIMPENNRLAAAFNLTSVFGP
jgi:hypothetical protein